MNMNYRRALFAQMRMFVIANEETEMTDESLVKAMTVNSNIEEAYGFCFKPADIIRLAKCPDIDSVYEQFEALQGEVLAEPMYPDFPKQVMEISEAEFRFHQLVHYFSTYGVRALFGVKVDKGWLPDVDSTEKTEADAALLQAKPVELITEADMFIVPVKRILGKRERMTLPEKVIVSTALQELEPAALAEIEIPFKENLVSVFCLLADAVSTEQALPMLFGLCQHSGDVWRCVKGMLDSKKWHLTTSQKKLLVKLFEMYPIADFKANLIITDAKAERVITLLEFLSFNRFSRSAEHKEAVRALRNGELRSWQGKVDYLLANVEDKDQVLGFIAQRPGMLVRMSARLLRLGYDVNDIADKLIEHGGALNMRTLVTLLNFFGTGSVREERGMEASDVYHIMRKALAAKMETLHTPIEGKKIFLDEGDFDFGYSRIEFNEKSAEGGYVSSGLAFKLPATAKIVRFFVYWNDEECVDIDLHSAAITKDGESVHIGWNGNFRDHGLAFSGDLTDSDSAEYVDIDLDETDVAYATFSIDLYDGAESFADIDTCFVGVTGVSTMKENVVLYDPKNCFYSNELRSPERGLHYGHIDVANRVLIVGGKPNGRNYRTVTKEAFELSLYSLQDYMEDLAEAQQAEIVEDRSDADVILVMGKPNAENELSIIDHNYFCD